MKSINGFTLPQQITLRPITGGKLILYLYDGVVRFCQEAITSLREGDTNGSEVNIGKAWAIIRELRRSLDHSVAEDLAYSLDQLYRFMENQLIEANTHTSLTQLEVVSNLLTALRDGWERAVDEANKSQSDAGATAVFGLAGSR